MEIAMLVISVISMIATIIPCIITIKAKNEAKKILSEINNIKVNTVSNSGGVTTNNTGINRGFISGINTGEVHMNDK